MTSETRALTEPRESYREILKSSTLIGGSQAANILIGVVRTKAMAILLGPAGFGLFGVYSSIQNFAQSIAGVGINSSGVRQISLAAAASDKHRIAQTATVLRRTALVLGALGALFLVTLSRPISQLTFGTAAHTGAICLLSAAVFFGLVSGAQGALIQGMRRIADLASINVLGAFLGLLTSIPLVYIYRDKGVAPSILVVAAMGIVTSWWYSRKINMEPVNVTLPQVREEASALLKLGSALMASSLMNIGVAYTVRVLLLRNTGYEAAGLYQSAWNLGGLYIGFILQAMGADFLPRLTVTIENHAEANRLVNEQTLVALLLAAPGVLLTLTFAPVILTLFYSAKFAAAVELLRWICLGASLQVITWPMGFIVVAKGRPALLFLVELAWTLAVLALTWYCLKRYGLNGAGIAFFASYIFHWALLTPIARWLTGFRWSTQNRRIVSMFLALIGLLFTSYYLLSVFWAAILGVVLTSLSLVYSGRSLLVFLPPERCPSLLRRLLPRVVRHPY